MHGLYFITRLLVNKCANLFCGMVRIRNMIGTCFTYIYNESDDNGGRQHLSHIRYDNVSTTIK